MNGRVDSRFITLVPDRRRASLIGPFLIAFAFGRTAAAQGTTDSVTAQALFDSARQLMAEGHNAEACPKLEESQRLDPSSGTLLNLARCYERTGKLAAAWAKYLDAASSAKAAGNAEREKMASGLAAEIAKRVPKLVIEVPPDSRVPGLEIERDGHSAGQPQWGLPIPADLGDHVLLARAPGYADWRKVVSLKVEASTTTVSVPRLELAAQRREATDVASSQAEDVTPVEAPSSRASAAAEADSGGLGTQRILALVSAGIGVAGLGVGTVFGLESISKHNEASRACDAGTCSTPEATQAGNDARDAGNVATVGFIIGAAGVVGGVTLWLTAPSAGSGGSSSALVLGPGSLQMRGTW